MKKNLFVIVLFTCFVNTGYAQYAYIQGILVTAEGITYNVGTMKYTVNLENADNKLDDALNYKDGTPLAEEDYGRIRMRPTAGTVARALMATFTETEYEKLGTVDKALVIYCYTSSDGKLLEIAYMLSKRLAAYISPQKFALLERNLKKYLTFTVNDFGKQLQYVHGPLFVNFSRIELPYGFLNIDNKLDVDDKFRQPIDFLNNERVMD